MSNIFSKFPDTVKASSQEPARRYVIVPRWFAIHGQAPRDARVDVACELAADGKKIKLCRGDADEAASILAVGGSLIQISPVYALDPDGDRAVPSGRIFVRFAAGVWAAERTDALARAGYEVLGIPPYAPQAAWVGSADGDISAALRGLVRLEDIEDVENVEPQMLRAMEWRSNE